MTPKNIMVVAGDPSGDANAAALVQALAGVWPEAAFFGAGGAEMARAGVRLSFDLTAHSAIGPTDAIKNLGAFFRRRRHLENLAKEIRPELVILVDSYSFNQPLARAIKDCSRRNAGGWRPKIVRYTSPQVWASRPGRAEKMARDIDLLLCLYPFEKEWYARRGTPLKVEFVGHPMFDRYGPPPAAPAAQETPVIVLLPGSRTDELKRHLPVMLGAARKIAATGSFRFKLVAPNEKMTEGMRAFPMTDMPKVEIQTGDLTGALSTATLAITKTGTISLECAYFGVPTLAMYKVFPPFYYLARPFITVKYLSMPNLLADAPLFPEYIQDRATAENLADAAVKLLADEQRRTEIQARLRSIIDSLGGSGSTRRAAEFIKQTMD